MSGHSIAWTHSGYGSAVGKITCHEPEGTPCRMVCNSGCESWAEGHGDAYWCMDETGQPWHEGDHLPECKHEYVAADQCSVVEWIDNEGALDLYMGDTGAPLRDGPIAIEWDDAPQWDYVEAGP